VTEILWSFSIFLESVAILPQLFMLSRTGEAETITTHYLFALGAYRALYIPNWVYRSVPTVASALLHRSGGRRRPAAESGW
jgi:ER lumen protein retaining receptor